MNEILYGRQPVRECLRAGRRHIQKLEIVQGVKKTGIIDDILSLADGQKIPVASTDRSKLDRISHAHQGVALHVSAYPYVSVDSILDRSARQDISPFILALDHLQDPHNLGALLRTAEAVGIHGVIIPNRRAATVTPAVVSASAGASEHVPVALVTNLVRTLDSMKDQDIWIVGLDNGPKSVLFDQVDLDRRLALVVGAEGVGLSRLVQKTCDLLIALPMLGQTASLNASVAGGVALYAALSARGFLAQQFDF